MQSIWYGRTENIFASANERNTLVDYTEKAVIFASAVNCKNLVFGCPRNRNIPSADYYPIAIDFFREIGDLAFKHGTTISIEPNPPIYNTNFINTTSEAFEICKAINHPGIKVNIDLGTLLYDNENLDCMKENIDLVNHIHISEPMLAIIEKRQIHKELANIDYDRWLSIEMKNTGNIETVKSIIRYVGEVLL